jgi:hypothetical protein
MDKIQVFGTCYNNKWKIAEVVARVTFPKLVILPCLSMTLGVPVRV